FFARVDVIRDLPFVPTRRSSDLADTFGLAQLHQLRGRVGRSRERGYAYFLYPQQAPLTETAYDRLATIAQNNELGAGMAVAMKEDRKSTRLNSSHVSISYAVFCL